MLSLLPPWPLLILTRALSDWCQLSDSRISRACVRPLPAPPGIAVELLWWLTAVAVVMLGHIRLQRQPPPPSPADTAHRHTQAITAISGSQWLAHMIPTSRVILESNKTIWLRQVSYLEGINNVSNSRCCRDLANSDLPTSLSLYTPSPEPIFDLWGNILKPTWVHNHLLTCPAWSKTVTS